MVFSPGQEPGGVADGHGGPVLAGNGVKIRDTALRGLELAAAGQGKPLFCRQIVEQDRHFIAGDRGIHHLYPGPLVLNLRAAGQPPGVHDRGIGPPPYAALGLGPGFSRVKRFDQHG